MPTREYSFYGYILGSRSRNLYIGMTGNIRTGIAQHRTRPEGSPPPATTANASSTSSASNMYAAPSRGSRS